MTEEDKQLEIWKPMFFRRDYKHFLMQRDAVGDCIIYIRLYHFGIIPYWYRFMDTYSHFSECLEIIKEWCCDNNIGRAIIHDPAGANPLMTIKYRQYKSEVLNELKQ